MAACFDLVGVDSDLLLSGVECEGSNGVVGWSLRVLRDIKLADGRAVLVNCELVVLAIIDGE